MSYNLKPSLAKGSSKCYVLAIGGPFTIETVPRPKVLTLRKYSRECGELLFFSPLVHLEDE